MWAGRSGATISGRALAVAVATMQPVSPAHACTLCHSRLADEVRAAVFDTGFWGDAAAVASPFPLLLVALAVVRRYLP